MWQVQNHMTIAFAIARERLGVTPGVYEAQTLKWCKGAAAAEDNAESTDQDMEVADALQSLAEMAE